MNESQKEFLRQVQELFLAHEHRITEEIGGLGNAIATTCPTMGATASSSTTSACSDICSHAPPPDAMCSVTEVLVPTWCDADARPVVAMGVGDLAASTPARCSMEVPCRDSTELRSASAPAMALMTPTATIGKEELGPGWAIDDVYPPLAELRQALLTDEEWAAMSSWEKDVWEMFYRPDWERLACIEQILVDTPATQRAHMHEEILEALRNLGASVCKPASAVVAVTSCIDACPCTSPLDTNGRVAEVPAQLCLPKQPTDAPVLVASSIPTPTEYIPSANTVQVAAMLLAVPGVSPAVPAPAVCTPKVQLQKLCNDSEVFMLSSSQPISSMVPFHRPIPWPSFVGTRAEGDGTRPLPWPSFGEIDCCESPSDAIMKPSQECSSGNLFTSTCYIVINDRCIPSDLRCLDELLLSLNYGSSASDCVQSVLVPFIWPPCSIPRFNWVIIRSIQLKLFSRGWEQSLTLHSVGRSDSSCDSLSSAFLDAYIGSVSCVTGIFVPDFETCSVLSWWSSCYAPVLLMEHSLEDCSMLKCKERKQCLLGEILVKFAVWLNVLVCCAMSISDKEEKSIVTALSGACYFAWISEWENEISYVVTVQNYHEQKEVSGIEVLTWSDLRVLIRLSWCARYLWSSLFLMVYTFWLLLQHVSTRVDFVDMQFLRWILIAIVRGCTTPLSESVNAGPKQLTLERMLLFLQHEHVIITMCSITACFSVFIAIKLLQQSDDMYLELWQLHQVSLEGESNSRGSLFTMLGMHSWTGSADQAWLSQGLALMFLLDEQLLPTWPPTIAHYSLTSMFKDPNLCILTMCEIWLLNQQGRMQMLIVGPPYVHACFITAELSSEDNPSCCFLCWYHRSYALLLFLASDRQLIFQEKVCAMITILCYLTHGSYINSITSLDSNCLTNQDGDNGLVTKRQYIVLVQHTEMSSDPDCSKWCQWIFTGYYQAPFQGGRCIIAIANFKQVPAGHKYYLDFDNVNDLQFQWDPGGSSARSAWGQAEFQGGRGVRNPSCASAWAGTWASGAEHGPRHSWHANYKYPRRHIADGIQTDHGRNRLSFSLPLLL